MKLLEVRICGYVKFLLFRKNWKKIMIFKNLIDILKLFIGCKSREVKLYYFIVLNRN